MSELQPPKNFGKKTQQKNGAPPTEVKVKNDGAEVKVKNEGVEIKVKNDGDKVDLKIKEDADGVKFAVQNGNEEPKHQEKDPKEPPKDADDPKPIHMDKSQDDKQKALAHEGKRGEQQIVEDITDITEIITKFALNKTANYQSTLRFLEKIMAEFKKSKGSFRAEISKADGDAIIQRIVKADPKADIKKLLSDWKPLIERVGEGLKILESLVEGNDIAELKKTSRELVEAAIKLFEHTALIEKRYRRNVFVAEVQKEKLPEMLRRLLALVSKAAYSIITVGLEKSAKSTWTNYLVGFQLVPTKAERCTMVPTCITNSDKPMKYPIEAEVVFHDKKSFEENLKELQDQEEAKLKQKANAAVENGGNKKEAPRKTIKEMEEEIRRAYESIKRPTITFQGEVADVKHELDNYIASEIYVYSVKAVNIITRLEDSEVLFEIIDVPGYDSTIKKHKEMTHNKIKDADAFIFVYDGHKPDLNDRATELLEAIKDFGGDSIFHKAFALISNLDKSENAKGAARNFEICKKHFTDKGINPDHVLKGCIVYDLYHLLPNLTPNEQDTLDKLQANYELMEDLLKGETERAKRTILHYVSTKLPKEVAKDVINTVKAVVEFAIALEQVLEDDKQEADNIANELDTYWDLAWKQATGMGWEFIYAIKPTFLDSAIAAFNAELQQVIEKHKKTELVSLVPKQQQHLRIVDLDKLEGTIRRGISQTVMRETEKLVEIIAVQIYDVCRELNRRLIVALGLDYSKYRSAFSIDKFITKKKCADQIEAQVMRVTFPAVTSYITFAYGKKEREIATKDLLDACPELENYVKKDPNYTLKVEEKVAEEKEKPKK